MSVVLTGRASRFLRVLQELGHLDDEGWAQVVLAAAREAGDDRRVGPELIRRHAARLLFERTGGQESPPLDRDWRVLFS